MIRTLGTHWNVAVVDSIGLGVVTDGPFRFVRHPNYAAVFVEWIALPLIHSAWITALAGAAAHAWVLSKRVPAKEPHGSAPISSRLNQDIEDVPVLVDSALVTAVVTGLAVWVATRPIPELPRQPMGFALPLPASDTLVASRSGRSIALSPDGRTLVYSAGRNGVVQLFRRDIGELEAVPIRGTEGGLFPVFSPDGRWVAFTVGTSRSSRWREAWPFRCMSPMVRR